MGEGSASSRSRKIVKNQLEKCALLWDISHMRTVKADDRRRVQIPDIRAGQVFAVDNHGDGTITLTVLRAETREPFPPGSLRKYAGEWNKELAPVARKMKVPAPPADWE